MAEQFSQLEEKHSQFIQQQPLYFVATAATDGRVNLSPKGLDSLRILLPNRIVWLNLTGSGNESAAHVAESPRMTLMFCSFGKLPLILRVYGNAKVIHPRDKQWPELIAKFPEYINARQMFNLDIDLVQTSCGFAVPHYDFKGERETLVNGANKRGKDGMAQYWKDKNLFSLDGKPTHLLDDE